MDLGFDSPGLIDIAGAKNIDQIVAYCESRGTLVREFTNFSRFGFKFNLPNYKASGSFSTWSGGIFGGATPPEGGGSGGGGDDPIAPDPGGGGGGGGGGATCTCVADNGSDLTVVVCTDIDCEDATPFIEITVCGGTAPYQWSISGGEGSPNAVQSGSNNRNVKVTAPDRADVSGDAYRRGLSVTNPGSCPNGAFDCANVVGCDDVEISGCTGPVVIPGSSFTVVCVTGGACDGLPDCAPCSTACGFQLGDPVDVRTAQMITDGCLPCAISMEGLNITVEDAVGDTVVTVIAL